MVKNVVVITLGYYPDMSPVSAVLDKYIQALKGKYHFHIIALQTREDFEPLNDSDIDIYYMNCFWRNMEIKYQKRCKEQPGIVDKIVYNMLRVRAFLMGIHEPYSKLRWIKKSSYDFLDYITKSTEIDTIISMSGNIIYLHEAALLFKERHPQVKWLTFVTDPISYSSLDYKRFKLNEKRIFKLSYNKEKKVYDNADYNIFTENLYYDALEKFHQSKEKTIQFRFVLENMQSIYKKEEFHQRNSITKLIYAGALYRQIRNPEFMLSVISCIPDVHLDMYVRSQQCMDILRKYESDKININSGVDVRQYKEMICNQYDILINIGNNCENQLPSKTLELLSSGRPIINFYHYKDSQYEMIERYPLGINIGRDDAKAVQKVDEFCKEMKGKQIPYNEIEKIFPENGMKRQIDILESLINS